jgi:hypothetical protein
MPHHHLTAAERLPPLTPYQACPQDHATAVRRPAGGLHGCRAADALARLGVVSGGTGWGRAVGGKGRLIFLYSYAGTVDDIKRKLAEMVEACNPSYLVWWIEQGFSPLPVVQRQLEIFSEKNMPEFVG